MFKGLFNRCFPKAERNCDVVGTQSNVADSISKMAETQSDVADSISEMVETPDYRIIPLVKDLEVTVQKINPINQVNVKNIRQCIEYFAKEAERKAFYNSDDSDSDTNSDEKEKEVNDREHVQDRTPVLGSKDKTVMINEDYGFFSTVLDAYNNHRSLRTCVEDWWFTIILKVAKAVDDHSKSEAVRNFFVSHEGKKKLTVKVGPSIYGVDYSWFLDQMTTLIRENIKVPNYVDTLKADFSMSTKDHVIISEITVMASLQEYFEYEMLTRCGIPNLEMEGTNEDWERLKTKFQQLCDILKPIHKDIGLDKNWWKDVDHILDQLIKAFNGKPNVSWWSKIFSRNGGWGSGARTTYSGWFITDLLGLKDVFNLSNIQAGIVTVPLTITDGISGHEEQSAFAAGIAGFELISETKTKWQSVKAAHGWTLMLEPDSRFRCDLVSWESNLTKGA